MVYELYVSKVVEKTKSWKNNGRGTVTETKRFDTQSNLMWESYLDLKSNKLTFEALWEV